MYLENQQEYMDMTHQIKIKENLYRMCHHLATHWLESRDVVHVGQGNNNDQTGVNPRWGKLKQPFHF